MTRIVAALLFLAFVMPAMGCFHRHHGSDKVIVVPPGRVKPLPPGKLKKLSAEEAQQFSAPAPSPEI